MRDVHRHEQEHAWGHSVGRLTDKDVYLTVEDIYVLVFLGMDVLWHSHSHVLKEGEPVFGVLAESLELNRRGRYFRRPAFAGFQDVDPVICHNALPPQ